MNKSWHPDPLPPVLHIGRIRGRAACLDARATIASSAAQHSAPCPYSRSALPEPGQPRQAAQDQGGERVGHAHRPAPVRPSDATERHPGHPPQDVEADHQSDHAINIGPNLCQQDFAAGRFACARSTLGSKRWRFQRLTM